MTNKDNVSTGKPAVGGAIHRAPLNTTLPKNAKEKLNEDFVSLGYISEEGLSNKNSPESENIKAWGGDTVATTQKGKNDVFTFTLIEAANVNVLKTVYGDTNVSGNIETGIEVQANDDESECYSWVVDMILKGEILKRIVIPSAKVTEIGDIVYKDDNLIGYATTINAERDENGNTHYEYLVKGE